MRRTTVVPLPRLSQPHHCLVRLGDTHESCCHPERETTLALSKIKKHYCASVVHSFLLSRSLSLLLNFILSKDVFLCLSLDTCVHFTHVNLSLSSVRQQAAMALRHHTHHSWHMVNLPLKQQTINPLLTEEEREEQERTRNELSILNKYFLLEQSSPQQ